MKITAILTFPVKFNTVNINDSFNLSMLANYHGINGTIHALNDLNDLLPDVKITKAMPE